MEFRLHAQLMVFASFLACAAFAEPPQLGVIKQFPLDERTVYAIPIGRDVPTTLMFPSAISAIEGANVSASTDTPAPVLLAYTPGQYFFSVRALTPGAKGAVNVVWRNRTFVLRFQEGPQPYGSVTFYEDDFTGGRAVQKRVTAEVLLGLLDRAKSYRLIELQYPEAVQQIEHAEPGTVCYYKNFQVTIEEVFRFDPEDTLVFKLRFENKDNAEVRYQPQRLAVRVGLNVYYPSIVDASGLVPPKAVTNAYLAITGSPAGGRANLSIKNTFNIIVTRVERDAKLIVPQ
ncbi:MAG: hypothetical protein KGJ37_05885 [Verrucomicrobiota bacterium]|nr:hypothetical protein [Verrucomicrobiota bacterium]